MTRVTDDNGYWIYTYDTYGNVRKQAYYDNFNALQEIHEYQYSTGNWKDQLTFLEISTREDQSGVSGSFTYDASGNPLTYFNGNNWTLTWKNGRQLATATKTGTSVSYGYDLNGLRTSKKVGGVTHTYLYAGGQLQRETYISGRITRKLDFLYDQNGRVVRETIKTGSTTKILNFIYDESGKPFALKYSTDGGRSFNTYYYILNLQGDVIKLLQYVSSSEYQEVASYTYDAWGNVLTASGSLAEINPLRYRGYYYDTETGFYYLQSRYYDPSNHRFINADGYASTGQGLIGTNMFAYCGNNPVIFKDDTGNERVAVIYDNTGEDDEFLAVYAETLKKSYESNGDTVIMLPVVSTDEIIDAWNSLGESQYDHVDILLHGAPGIIACNGNIGTNSLYNPVETFDALNDVHVRGSITLYSCNGGTYVAGGSVAQILANKARTSVKAASHSKVYFSKSGRVCWGINIFAGRWVKFTYFPTAIPRGGNRRVTK